MYKWLLFDNIVIFFHSHPPRIMSSTFLLGFRILEIYVNSASLFVIIWGVTVLIAGLNDWRDNSAGYIYSEPITNVWNFLFANLASPLRVPALNVDGIKNISPVVSIVVPRFAVLIPDAYIFVFIIT